jgi:Post-segregation antitoxin CcdA
MDAAKQKISVTIDADLLRELRNYPGSVSAQLNEALRTELARRHNREAWQSILSELDVSDGPLDKPEDRSEQARIEEVWRALDAAGHRDRRAS